MSEAYHFPPELIQLLVEAIPRLCKTKRDTIVFFKTAGVGTAMLADLEATVQTAPDDINKFHIVRTVLTRLNDRGDAEIRSRREVLRRVCQWDDFTACYENNRLEAKGLVAQIKDLVGLKDSVTRLQQEHERERNRRREEADARALEQKKRVETTRALKKEFYELFDEKNPATRGKSLESVLNRLFAAFGILVEESFTVNGADREGIVQQIDGAIRLDTHLILVEMKWHSEPLGRGDIAPHIVRLYQREGARGLIISYSRFTDPAVSDVRLALSDRTVVLCELEELVRLLDAEADLCRFLRAKFDAAVLRQDPVFRPGP